MKKFFTNLFASSADKNKKKAVDELLDDTKSKGLCHTTILFGARNVGKTMLMKQFQHIYANILLANEGKNTVFQDGKI